MAKDNLTKVLCFAGGVATTVAFTHFLARKDKQHLSRQENEIKSLQRKLHSKINCAYELLQKFLDVRLPAQDALHAVISVAQELSITTDSLDGDIDLDAKIKEATCVWRELISSSDDHSIFFSAISKAEQISLDPQPFVEQWKDWALLHGDNIFLFSVLSGGKAKGLGIDEGSFKSRWIEKVANSYDSKHVYSAISQANAIGVEVEFLKHRWQELVLDSNTYSYDYGYMDIENIFSSIPLAAEIGLDIQPFKDKVMELIAGRSYHLSKLFDYIPRCAEVGIDSQFLREPLKQLAFTCEDCDTLVSAMQKLVETCAVPTGKVVMAQVSPVESSIQLGLVVSFQLLSGAIALPQANVPLDATVATLQAHVMREKGWQSAQIINTLSNSPLQNNEALREFSDVVVQELGISLDDKKNFVSRLLTLLGFCSRWFCLNKLLSLRGGLKTCGIDIVELPYLREWISSSIPAIGGIDELQQLEELVFDVPRWSSALSDQLKLLEARAEKSRCLRLRPSVGTWLLPKKKTFLQEGEYRVRLDRTDGTRLGVDVDNQDRKTLLIESITAGVVQTWNNRNPLSAVRVGDRLVEVNGIREDLVALIDECKKRQVLECIFLRR